MRECLEAYLEELEPGVQKLIAAVRSERERKGTCSFERVEELMRAGGKYDSDMLRGMAYYYMAEAYLNLEDKEQVSLCLANCIKYLQDCESYEYIARSYNVLGVMAQSQDNINMAIEHYDNAIHYCEEYGLDYVHALALTNMAGQFYAVGCYEIALNYYNEALVYYEKDKKGAFYWVNLLMMIQGKMNCLYALERLDELFVCGERVEEIALHIGEEKKPVLILNNARALLCWLKGEQEQADVHMRAAGEVLQHTGILECYDNLLDYLNLLAVMGKYKELSDAIDLLEEHMKNMQDSDFLLQLLMLRLRYCGTQMTMEEEQAQVKRFLRVYRIKQNKNGEAVMRNMGLRREMQKIQEKQYELKLQNKKLLVSSLHDALTGLPNRGYLNQYLEEVFEKAYQEEKRLGVCLVDIDGFKQINDKWGHMEGDKCLASVAEVLKIISREENVFCARYGGDEFTLIFYDSTRKEMEQVLGRLMEMVKRIRFSETEISDGVRMSLSAGGLCRIPASGNRLWDFMSVADVMLYRVKGNGKNGFMVTEDLRVGL